MVKANRVMFRGSSCKFSAAGQSESVSRGGRGHYGVRPRPALTMKPRSPFSPLLPWNVNPYLWAAHHTPTIKQVSRVQDLPTTTGVYVILHSTCHLVSELVKILTKRVTFANYFNGHSRLSERILYELNVA